jgi:immune inhibitor A
MVLSDPDVPAAPPTRVVDGTHEIVVILIDFDDHQAETAHDEQFYRTLLFAADSSLADYYDAVSDGQLTVRGQIPGGWLRSSHPMSWYGADTGPNDANPDTHDDGNVERSGLAREAVQLADALVDFSQFDRDGDGTVDHVCIVHAGGKQESSGTSTDIWSHRGAISGGETVDGVTVSGYFLLSEDSPMGTFAHEFAHDLGAPDLYDTDRVDYGEVAGNWCLMDNGSWNNSGTTPAIPSAYIRSEVFGWIDPQDVVGSLSVGIEQAASDAGTRIARVNVAGSDEYFLVENRQQSGFDSHVPESGILIWHIDPSMPANAGPPNNDYYCVQLEQPGGSGTDKYGNEFDGPNYRGAIASAAYSVDGCQTVFSPLSKPTSNANDGSTTGISIIVNDGEGASTSVLIDTETATSEALIHQGLGWLRCQQNTNGSWSNSVGESAMAVLGFLNAGYEEGSSIVDAGILYILSKRNADGSFDDRKTYETSLALVVLSATHNPEYADEIDDAKDFLLADCWDEGEGYDRNDWYYGGYGYGSDERPDLSNTQFAAIALYEAGVPAEHAIWDKIELFTTRCQNRPASNEQAFAHNTGLPSYDDGGFIYYPGVSIVWDCVSTGTMTAAGIWALRLCGVPVGDARIQAALQWVLDHEDCSFDETPNQGTDWVSNYIWSVAKALVMCYVDELACGYWYPNLVASLEGSQSEDGSWSMSLGTLVDTCFSLLALQSAQPIQSTHWIRLILASHADLHVYDPQGRHLGLDYDTGQMESEIPGASFTTDAQGRQLVDLPELEAGRYRIELVGTGDGEYSLTVTGYDDQDETSSETVQGTISTTGTHVVDVVVSSLIGSLTIFVEEPRPVPSGLFSVPGDAQVSLYWDEYAADGFELAHYNVYRSEASDGSYGLLAPGPGLETRYQDNNAQNGTTYYYVVTASSTAETETEYSWEVAATPSASGGSSLVRNGGFEEGLAGWRTTGGTAVFGFGETSPREGTRCALGEETAAGNLGRLYQDVTERVTPGQYYQISGWMKRADTTGATVFGLDYVDENGSTPGGGFVREIGFVDGGGTSDWTYFESDAFVLPEMPDDCEALWVLVDFNACTGAVWVDGIELRQLGNCGAVDMTVAPAGWHMISIPGQLCDPCTWTDGVICGDLVCALGDDIDPFYAFRYDADLRSYARVPPADEICYQPGMGMWIYTWDADTEIDSEVTALTGNVELALQNGWNQVGNPYTFSIGTGSIKVRCGAEELSLIEAQAQGWITALLYGYDTSAGVYVEIDPASGCLPAWFGCWLRAYRADCTLIFQPVGCTSSLTQSRLLSTAEARALELPPPPPLNPQAFDIKEVLAGLSATNIPNPIRSEHTTVFRVEGVRADMVDELRVDIYDQSGQRVFTQAIAAKELAWHTVNDAGELLANGVYLYRVWVKIGEIWYPLEVQKLAVVR